MAENDERVSPDTLKPQGVVQEPLGESVLGRPDQGVSHDALKPQEDIVRKEKSD
jgi:hypothetical protein